MQGCTDADGFACLGTAAGSSIEQEFSALSANSTTAPRLANPTSAEFGDMKRAMRKNTLGQSVDTICGRVKEKTATGEDTGDKAFLYLVNGDEAYVVDGAPSSAAATAYRNICNQAGSGKICSGFPKRSCSIKNPERDDGSTRSHRAQGWKQPVPLIAA